MPDKKRVIALGFFDGVHAGHAALMEMTRRRAAERDAIPTVITFDTHPDTLVKGVEVPLINSPEERAEIIRRIYGIDSVVFIHFSEKTMHMPWREFIDSVTEEMRACHYVVGYDFSFGWKGEGRPARLAAYCTEHGPGLRHHLRRADRRRGGELHAHPRAADGGAHRGGEPPAGPPALAGGHGAQRLPARPQAGLADHQHGFAPGVLVPRHGVYAAKVFLDDGTERMAVTNVGVRPTVSGGDHVSVESYILDYDGDLYDHRVRVEFHHFIRDERRFPDTTALRDQIQHDAQTTRDYFAANP